jgi:two-component system sensor histidine kinase and response regulator WspE
VDLLQNLSQLTIEQVANWLGQQLAEFRQTQGAIANLLNPDAPLAVDKKVIIPAVEEEGAPVSSLPPETDSTELVGASRENFPNQDRVVRVSADNLNRIMGLAGESLIEANWLQPFADAMMVLKGRLTELSRSLEQLEESAEQHKSFDEGKEYLNLARQYEQECFQLLGERLSDLELYVRRTANLSDRLYREVITSHMRPFADGVGGFPRMIRDLARQLNKQVKLEILGKSTPVDRDILKKLEAPLTHILRNALDHGIETPEERVAQGKPAQGTIRLEALHRAGMLGITISDDGRGINLERLRQKICQKNLASEEMVLQMSEAELLEFLFLPGFSTAKQVTEISGRGVGLDIAKSMVQEVRGTVRAVSQVGKGTSFHFQLPLTLSVMRTLLVEISGKPYAIPLARIEQITTVERSQIANVENRQYFTMNQQNVGLITAYQLLELPQPQEESETVAAVVISDQSQSYGLVVDRFLEERDLVVKPLDPRLGKVPDISATASLSDGSPILILDVSDLVHSMDALLNTGKLAKVGQKSEGFTSRQRKQILVVDDSITVREMERKLLENYGYDVDIAVNGVEGWNAIRTKHYDIVITDVDMPRMNGIELVRQIRSHPRVQSLPVIIVSYRDSEEDRLQGLEVGANYYLTKSSFHDETFLEAVVDLIGH